MIDVVIGIHNKSSSFFSKYPNFHLLLQLQELDSLSQYRYNQVLILLLDKSFPESSKYLLVILI